MAVLGGNTTVDLENATSIASIADYQTVRALVGKLHDAYETRLEPDAPASSADAVARLKSDVARLDNATEAMAPPIEIIKIIHTQAQISLMEVYGLELKHNMTASQQSGHSGHG